jgi:hypothetical protein
MKKLWSWVGHVVTPLWKGAAKRILRSQSRDLRGKVKSLIDDDQDASIKRVNDFFDKRQAEIEAKLRGLQFLPGTLEDRLAESVEENGNAMQEKLIAAIKERGPAAIDALFDGLESKLDAIIDKA